MSHDRYILDLLCDKCIFIDSSQLIIRPGGVTKGKKEENIENEALLKKYQILKKEKEKKTKELIRRKTTSQSKLRKLSKKKLDPGDSDGRAKRDLARLSGKDAVGGKLIRQISSKTSQIDKKIGNLKKIDRRKTGKRIDGVYSKKRKIFFMSSRVIVLYRNKVLVVPDLVIRNKDRISITGRNGSGKTTLVKEIVDILQTGSEKILYLPQEMTGDEIKKTIEEFHSLKKTEKGIVLSNFSRLGSLPEYLLATSFPSPGEIRKLFFAMEMRFPPELIILDEPTNHLDIASIECLEKALLDCNCALLLVSHDEYFVHNLTSSHWHIDIKNNDCLEYELNIQ